MVVDHFKDLIRSYLDGKSLKKKKKKIQDHTKKDFIQHCANNAMLWWQTFPLKSLNLISLTSALNSKTPDPLCVAVPRKTPEAGHKTK